MQLLNVPLETTPRTQEHVVPLKEDSRTHTRLSITRKRERESERSVWWTGTWNNQRVSLSWHNPLAYSCVNRDFFTVKSPLGRGDGRVFSITFYLEFETRFCSYRREGLSINVLGEGIWLSGKMLFGWWHNVKTCDRGVNRNFEGICTLCLTSVSIISCRGYSTFHKI